MLRLEGVSVRYGPIRALDGVDLVIADNERLSVLGPSGSGKSTLLRVICGLEQPAAGRVSWNGRDLAAVPVHARGFGLMFQDYVLFPHHDVAGNVAFGLRLRGDPAGQVDARVAEVLEMVGLGSYGHRRVTELSGGEQQRVALARALAPAPSLLMLDEPLGALDRSLRQRLLSELSDLFDRLSLTIIYVTHDQEEALAVGDRVALMREGRIETVMPPEQLWRHPPSEFAARFLGFNNVAEAEIDEGGRVHTPWGVIPLEPALRARGPVDRPNGEPGTVRVLLRPEGFRPDPDGPVRGTVSARRFSGDRAMLEIAVPGAPPLEVHAEWPELPRVGQELSLRVEPAAVVLLT